jgi:hypothetical protein
MLHQEKEKKVASSAPASSRPVKKGISAFFPKHPADGNPPALIYFSETPLFRLEKCAEKYAHLLKKKDMEYIGPIVNYLINNSGQVAFLAGDVVRNLYLFGRRKYKTIGILAILTAGDVYKYSGVMNNIISSNDGAFSMGFKYLVKKNRLDGCFKNIAVERYIIEQRLEGPAKLLSPFKPTPIELDLTTQSRFSGAFGVELA